ncbi:cell wall adhesin EAP1-like, partial [Homalodisca vitripennis]|uniref:cell wall adhesin EAP1-like n=1 Tax=Homalodisca vitripennis TaxID=197043 RepID=UPI001EEBB357
MVRNYVRKTGRGKYEIETMERAVKEVRGGRSMRSVAAEFGLCDRTLANYCKKLSAAPGSTDPSNEAVIIQPNPIISTTVNNDLVIPDTSTRDPAIPGTSTHDLAIPGPSTRDPVIPGTSTHDLAIPGPSVRDPVIPGTSTHDLAIPGPSTRDPVIPGTSTHDLAIPGPSTRDPVIPGTSTHDLAIPGPSTRDPVIPGTSTHDLAIPGPSVRDPAIPGASTEGTAATSQSAQPWSQFGYARNWKVFEPFQEQMLAEYLLKASDIYFGLTPKEVRRFAYTYAVACNCKIPPSL